MTEDQQLAQLVGRIALAGNNGTVIPDKGPDRPLLALALDRGLIRDVVTFATIFRNDTRYYVTERGVQWMMEHPELLPTSGGGPGPVGPLSATPPVEEEAPAAPPAEEVDPAPTPAPVPAAADTDAGDGELPSESGETSPAPEPEPTADPIATEGEGQASGDQPPPPAPVLPGGDPMAELQRAVVAGLQAGWSMEELRGVARDLVQQARAAGMVTVNGRTPLKFTRHNVKRWARAIGSYSLAGVDEDPAP